MRAAPAHGMSYKYNNNHDNHNVIDNFSAITPSGPTRDVRNLEGQFVMTHAQEM